MRKVIVKERIELSEKDKSVTKKVALGIAIGGACMLASKTVGGVVLGYSIARGAGHLIDRIVDGSEKEKEHELAVVLQNYELQDFPL